MVLPTAALRRRLTPRILRSIYRGFATTYSQYGEDLIFERLLSPGKHGIYVDVGSHDPVFGSNTYALYRRGWRGITIDPNPEFVPAYREWRPDEPHIVEGIAQAEDVLTYFEFENSVFNTFSSERADELAGFGEPALGRKQIRCRPLQDLVDEFLPGRQIDLLTVDCEGFDLTVLKSLALEQNRPTTIIVEDYDQFRAYRDGSAQGAMHEFLTASGYCPIAQMAFSAIYVARDWEELFALSDAFDAARAAKGVLPKGQ